MSLGHWVKMFLEQFFCALCAMLFDNANFHLFQVVEAPYELFRPGWDEI